MVSFQMSLSSQQQGPKLGHTSVTSGQEEGNAWHQREARSCQNVLMRDTRDKMRSPEGPCLTGRARGRSRYADLDRCFGTHGCLLARTGQGRGRLRGPGFPLHTPPFLSFLASSDQTDRPQLKPKQIQPGLWLVTMTLDFVKVRVRKGNDYFITSL